jgi:hypothetical protein
MTPREQMTEIEELIRLYPTLLRKHLIVLYTVGHRVDLSGSIAVWE